MGLREPLTRGARGGALVAAFAAALAAADCGAGERILLPGPPAPVSSAGYPGFDIGTYPGDAALAAWRFPVSPYYWVGYYLAAPCHRDVTWMGKRSTAEQIGWGSAVLYVGQQDWARIPDIVLMSRLSFHGFDAAALPALLSRLPDETAATASASTMVTCSATLLTAQQGAADAADAVAKTGAEGFAPGTAVYLDVEYVSEVAPPLAEYVRAWFDGVLADGRFVPAIYVAKSNAAALYPVVTGAFAAAHRADVPRFWVASSSNFSLASAPTDVGLSYAAVWQGGFDRSESWGGYTRTIDQNVAATPSPSAP